MVVEVVDTKIAIGKYNRSSEVPTGFLPRFQSVDPFLYLILILPPSPFRRQVQHTRPQYVGGFGR